MSIANTLKTQLPRKIKDLPNIAGFEFIGVRFDGTMVDCFVKKSLEGQYIILRKSNNDRLFQQLSGWIKC
jgi:hypothetical protein